MLLHPKKHWEVLLEPASAKVKMTHAQGEIRDVNICSIPGSVYMSVEQQSCHYARAELHPLCFESTWFLCVTLGSRIASGITFQWRRIQIQTWEKNKHVLGTVDASDLPHWLFFILALEWSLIVEKLWVVFEKLPHRKAKCVIKADVWYHPASL